MFYYPTSKSTKLWVPPMAIMHLSVKNGLKGKGAPHALYIEREGKYSNREDLFVSESGNMPVWAKDNPNHFWECADKYERLNGRVYKELEISLPRELSPEQQIELVREFTKNVVGSAHAFTWAIHNPSAKDGELNSHVHLMFSDRTHDGIERTESQFFKRYNPFNPHLGGAGKNRLLIHKAFVETVREEWSATVNHKLQKLGFDSRIDHRSYQKMGIDLLSQNVKKFYSPFGNLESKSTFELSQELRDKQKINGERIIENPDIALKALTAKSSTFTKRDLEKFIFSHTDGAEQYLEAYNRVLGSIQIQFLDHEKNVYSTSDMLQTERELINIVERSNKLMKTPSFNERSAFLTAFKAMEKRSADRGKVVEPEQKRAFEILTGKGQIAIVNGAAGTGKSFVLQGVREAYENAKFNVVGTAIQGVTAQSMERDAGIQSRTVASLLARLRWEEKNYSTFRKSTFDKNTVLIVDEAGMVGSQDMRELLGYAETHKVKVRMVGDAYQLNAVSAGGAFSKIQGVLNPENQTSLNVIVRQNDAKHREASIAMSKHDIKTGIEIHAELGNIQAFDTQVEARNRIVAQWAQSPKSAIMLAYTNNDVNAMNKAARILQRDSGKLQGDDFEVNTVAGKISVAQGEEIIFNKPSKDLEVLNGTRGRVEAILRDKTGAAISLGVQVDGKRIQVDLVQYNEINHGYASTIHKAQGVTVDDAYVLASSSMNANLTYVANTRHRDNLTFVYSREQFENQDELIKSLSKKEEKTYSANFDVIREHKDVQTRITERETLAGRSLYTQRSSPMELSIQERMARSKAQNKQQKPKTQHTM